MMPLLRSIRADMLKTKRTPFLMIHVLVPLIATGLILAYYSYSPWGFIDKADVYFQVLGCAFPALIGIVCAMAAEQEEAAGHFQGLLTASGFKLIAYASKLVTLLVFGLGAVLLACTVFYIGFAGVLQQDRLGFAFYLTGAAILFGGNLFLYLLHLSISLYAGKGPSIGLGIAESLVAALLLTGLGDSIWTFIPCGWGVRFTTLWTLYTTGADLASASPQIHTAIAVCLLGTALAFLLSCVWFQKWEGRRSDN